MIYLDNNATTPLHPEVIRAITEFLPFFGNPSSAHSTGRAVRQIIEDSRSEAASFLNCLPEEIIFTASGSEANNTILKSACECRCRYKCNPASKAHIISSNIEHPSVLSTLKCLEHQGVEVTYVPVSPQGIVDPDDVRRAIRPDTALISIMAANNEIGTLQPIEAITQLAHEHDIEMHTDAVQAAGKIILDLKKLPVDSLSISGHKIYAPKGVGILYKRKGSRKLCPLINGGHQENELRAGTENTIGIIAAGEAFRQLKKEMDTEIVHVLRLRKKLEKGILEKIPDVIINGDIEKRLPGTVNFSFKYIEGESIMLRLDMHGIAVSTGSACATGSLDPSPVILALGAEAERAHGSIRFSLGRQNTEQEIETAVEKTAETVAFLRRLSPLKA